MGRDLVEVEQVAPAEEAGQVGAEALALEEACGMRGRLQVVAAGVE